MITLLLWFCVQYNRILFYVSWSCGFIFLRATSSNTWLKFLTLLLNLEELSKSHKDYYSTNLSIPLGNTGWIMLCDQHEYSCPIWEREWEKALTNQFYLNWKKSKSILVLVFIFSFRLSSKCFHNSHIWRQPMVKILKLQFCWSP